jgi:hypothetical protein
MAARQAVLLVYESPEERPIPVNPVENGDKQAISHQPLLSKVQNSFLTL